MNFEEKFEVECEKMFWENINTEISYLYQSNKKYKNVSHKCVEIIKKYPNLKDIIENGVAVNLDRSETEKLIKYISMVSVKDEIEKKQIFFSGARTMYFYMKKLGLLKQYKKD